MSVLYGNYRPITNKVLITVQHRYSYLPFSCGWAFKDPQKNPPMVTLCLQLQLIRGANNVIWDTCVHHIPFTTLSLSLCPPIRTFPIELCLQMTHFKQLLITKDQKLSLVFAIRPRRPGLLFSLFIFITRNNWNWWFCSK